MHHVIYDKDVDTLEPVFSIFQDPNAYDVIMRKLEKQTNIPYSTLLTWRPKKHVSNQKPKKKM